jgi:Short repeat of unknown function (DUF308)
MTTTMESTESRPAEAIGRIGKHWGWMLAFGIFTIAAGICALAWPGITLLAAAIVFGVQLIVAGIYRLVAAFAAPEKSTGTPVMLGVLGGALADHRPVRGPACAARDPRPVPGVPDRRLAYLLRPAADGAGAPAPLGHALGSRLGRDAARSHVTTPRVSRGAV